VCWVSMGLAVELGVLLKPKVLLAMLGLYLTTYVASLLYQGVAAVDPSVFGLGFAAVALSVAGANALNCVYDVDIDSVMSRTLGRPLVRGVVSTQQASAFSWGLMVLSGLVALRLGPIPSLLLVEGAGSYLLLYTVLAKRRTRFNVFFTAPSVAAPAWLGWFLGGAPFLPVGLLLGLLVALWGPLHLWSLAYVFSEDYSRAGVPMYVGGGRGLGGVLVVMLGLVGGSLALARWCGGLYLWLVAPLNLLLLWSGVRLWREGSKRWGWVVFKLTSPYILLVFLFFALSLLRA